MYSEKTFPIKLVAGLIALFIAAPMFIVIPMSFSTAPSLEFPPPGYWLGYYQRFFTDRNWTLPLFNSIVIGLGTTVLTLALAAPAAFALVRHDFRGKALLNLVLMMPLVVPHIVMALAYYSYFGALRLVQSYTGLILAHTCLSMPVAILILTAALKTFDRNLERAAANLGSRPLTTFRLVTLPVLKPAFLVAGLFVFIHSFDETVIALFISGRDTTTLPRQMFNSFLMQADPVLSAASSVLFTAVLIAVAVPAVMRAMRRRRPTPGRA
ncbi:ABC transporter permease [Chelatococcus asaccharovorans]|uniref:Putative spermidine/putrescine transport system permease protein n=1 Tax=Chelatococcus asaccharovorans TaxID=28210 RepID=A0A2V3U8Y7_9HYPH|nr:ABC transporter permease [Chelatococcus asaccharovorans]MBS7705330.1 ABC transporter permease [Chelatococcus asaccharovorans]PXW60267.1 putative spermidine/putrescine transport system permease protein [Chelatococcus asaccharovorans]